MDSIRQSLPPLAFLNTDRRRDSQGRFGASVPNLNDLQREYDTVRNENQLIEPADNLNEYLRTAIIPKWERWLDPDAIPGGKRWDNPNLWGTGEVFAYSRQGAQGRRTSAKHDTIQRLVQAVARNARDEPGNGRFLVSWEPRRGFLGGIMACKSKLVRLHRLAYRQLKLNRSILSIAQFCRKTFLIDLSRA